jgi:hypothetical protein
MKKKFEKNILKTDKELAKAEIALKLKNLKSGDWASFEDSKIRFIGKISTEFLPRYGICYLLTDIMVIKEKIKDSSKYYLSPYPLTERKIKSYVNSLSDDDKSFKIMMELN